MVKVGFEEIKPSAATDGEMFRSKYQPMKVLSLDSTMVTVTDYYTGHY